MSTKHTPGPWSYFKQTCEDKFRPDFFNVGADALPGENKHIARVATGNGWSDVEGKVHHQDLPGEANARLIAAAPDCLAALDEIAQLAHNGGFPDMSVDELRKLLFSCGNCAMIAIAKATGDEG